MVFTDSIYNSICSSLKTRPTPSGTPGVLSYLGTASGLRYTGFCLVMLGKQTFDVVKM